MDDLTGWQIVDEDSIFWGLVGGPIHVSLHEGVVAGIEASSEVDLFAFITSPMSTTLHVNLNPR